MLATKETQTKKGRGREPISQETRLRVHEHFYGLNGKPKMSREEIAVTVGISYNSVRNILKEESPSVPSTDPKGATQPEAESVATTNRKDTTASAEGSESP
jgi:hypothetical protein